jgi:small-conductance mechanosensitive channel
MESSAGRAPPEPRPTQHGSIGGLRLSVAEDEKSESLETEVEQILEEARMVLPGIQALFGFQLIAVFSERFDQALGEPGKRLHVTAVVLTAVAIGLIMAPAAYHRQAERDRVSRYFANYASFLITLAMAPLSIALAMEVALVAFLATGQPAASTLIGTAVILFMVWLWYVFPAYRKHNQVTRSKMRRNGRT